MRVKQITHIQDGTIAPGPRYRLAKWIWPAIGITYEALLESQRRVEELTKSNKELMEDMKACIQISPSQLVEFTRITQEHAKLNDQQNAITVFLRDNFPGVKAGKYAGMQFSEMVVAIIRESRGYKSEDE
jgi:hypothetical protein